jgi:hypothetical protein
VKKSFIQFAILLVTLVLTQTAFADIKIKTRQSMSGSGGGGQASENTTYIKGKRQRIEMQGGQMVSITQCDLRRDIQLVPASKAYMINPFGGGTQQEKPSVTQTLTTVKTENGGTVTMTYTTKDTGERKQMFGYTARHLIITIESEASPDACRKDKTKMQMDGWYIDAEWAFQCDRSAEYANYLSQTTGCKDKYVIKEVGGGSKRGYPVYEKMTMFDESGKESYSSVNEVIELSKATLDSALFDIPADYRQAKNSQELYSSMPSSNDDVQAPSATMSSSNQSSNNSGLNTTLQNAANQQSQAQTQNELGAKKQGVVRIALAGVKTGSVGESVNAAELAGAIQNTLAQYLKTPNIEVIQLEAKLPSAIDAEAKQKECDYVVYTNVSHKKGGGGGFGMFKKIAPVLGNVVPMAGATGSVAASVAAQTIYTAATMSQNVKSKDEISLDVKMNAPGNSVPALSKQVKAKAKSDGEDIISPLIEQIATAIVETASK